MIGERYTQRTFDGMALQPSLYSVAELLPDVIGEAASGSLEDVYVAVAGAYLREVA